MRLGFIIFGLFLISFAQASTLTCSRIDPRQGSCRLARSGFLWSDEREMPINKLQGAKYKDRKGNNIGSSQVVIYTSNGEVPFSPFTTYTNEAQQRAIASRISSFIKNREQSYLEVEQNDKWWILVGSISLAVGVFPLLKPKS